MGLKNGSSENVGLPELVTILQEFERSNSVELELQASIVEGKRRKDWEFRLLAFSVKDGEVGVMPLALVRRRCMESRLVTMEALLLQLLYSMDFELALLEFQSTKETE